MIGMTRRTVQTVTNASLKNDLQTNPTAPVENADPILVPFAEVFGK